MNTQRGTVCRRVECFQGDYLGRANSGGLGMAKFRTVLHQSPQ